MLFRAITTLFYVPALAPLTLVSRHVEIALALVLITIFSLYALERLQRRRDAIDDSHIW